MCNCIKAVDDALANTNTMLDIPLMIDFKTGKEKPPRMMIAVCKRDPKKREKAMLMPANYCPCCGEKYEATSEASK